MSSNSSHSGESSDGDPLDPETISLLQDLPIQACIGSALDKFVLELPAEAVAILKERGSGVAISTHVKTSFHKTFLVELSPHLQHDGKNYQHAIVQVIGVEMGDKAVFNSLEVATLVRAHELAARAGVRVPAIFAIGQCETGIGSMEFIIEEFVQTETIEDKVMPPRNEFCRLRQEVIDKLKSLSLVDVETSPLPRFDSSHAFIDHLLTLVPASDDALTKALLSLRETAPASGTLLAPVLLHQDINPGNLLCSRNSSGDSWKVDALIDWESAAVAESKIYDNDDQWAAVESFSTIVKLAHLAERFVRGTLPRCELRELVENYQDAAQRLDKGGLLPFETWAKRVARSREELIGVDVGMTSK